MLDVKANPTLTLGVMVFTYLGLMLIGFVTASQGPLLGSIKSHFAVDDATVAWLFVSQLSGAMLGNGSGGLLERTRVGWRMAGGLLVFAVGAFGVALAGVLVAWWLLLVAVLVMGLGFGTFQVNYAALFSRGFGERSGAVMGVMSTSFAIGSMLGPTAAGVLLARQASHNLLYVACAVVALCIAGFMRGVQENPPASTDAPGASGSNLVGLAGFAVFVALYVAAETGVSNWSPTHLHEGLGVPEDRAAYLTTFFWVALTLGRALTAPLSLRFSSQNLILASMLVSSIGLVVAHVPSVAFLGYWLSGFGMAPVFPVGLVWLGREFRQTSSTGVYLLAGTFGALLSAPLIGWLKSAFGANTIPSVLLALSVLTLLSAFGLIGFFKNRVLDSE